MEDSIFNGKPSIVLSHRPFFSIIIPCYNSRNTIGALLNSIINQHMNDDIEVILSDDRSTESYQDIVDAYKGILSIRQIQTDYNCCPGNTREKGVSIAEGEWICFADHDDEFVVDSLPEVKNTIIVNQERYFAVANFYEKNPDTNTIIREMKQTGNWCHAKFYNLQNLWKATDIHFQKDLISHEDICISSQINCSMHNLNRTPLRLNIFCYYWNSRPTTLSRTKYKDGRPFLEVFMRDYITSTGGVYLSKFSKNQLPEEYTKHNVIQILLYLYFYMQGFKFHYPDTYDRTNEQYCRAFFIQVKKILHLTNRSIWDYCAAGDAKLFTETFEGAALGAGPYIPKETFAQWLDLLHEDLNVAPAEVMKDLMSKENMPTEPTAPLPITPAEEAPKTVLDFVNEAKKEEISSSDTQKEAPDVNKDYGDEDESVSPVTSPKTEEIASEVKKPVKEVKKAMATKKTAAAKKPAASAKKAPAKKATAKKKK